MRIVLMESQDRVKVKVLCVNLMKEAAPAMIVVLAQVTLLFFAKSRELSGVRDTSVSLPSSPGTGAQLWDHLLSLYPRFQPDTLLPLTQQPLSVSLVGPETLFPGM